MHHQETRYVVQRADGKYLVIATTLNNRRLATWIADVDLATSWPFMTGATLAMGLDLDPCLTAERGGWDVIPITPKDPVVETIAFRLAVTALALLLSVTSVAAQPLDWKPYAVLIAGQTSAAVAHERFLHNGSGCTGTNPLYTPNPSLRAVLVPAAIIGASAVALKLANNRPAARTFTKVLSYVLGVGGVVTARQNIATCGV